MTDRDPATDDDTDDADTNDVADANDANDTDTTRRRRRIPLGIVVVAAVVLLVGVLALRHSEAQVNDVALSSSPKRVTAVEPKVADYQQTRRYVGRLAPWQQAAIGPQLTSGFVDTVLVRPGDRVERGDILATLDCRDASLASQAVALEARALEASQQAIAKETARLEQMQAGGFVAEAELEQARARAASTSAHIEGLKARLDGRRLRVDDCVLRAPFAGEIAERLQDPGAFVRPGAPILTLIDRSILRLVVDIPETEAVAAVVGKAVDVGVLGGARTLTATITRVAPTAAPTTRTIPVEIDITPGDEPLPAGTTALVELDVGAPRPSIELPLTAAQIRGDRATLFAVKNGAAHEVVVDVVGESGASVFVSGDALGADVDGVVVEGRRQLRSGDVVEARTEAWQ